MGAKSSRLPSPAGAGAGAGAGTGTGAAGAGAAGAGAAGARAGGQASDSSSSARPTPLIEAPYAGPWAEYQFLDVTVPVQADVALAFSDVRMASTHCATVLPSLASVYSQGYSLATFCRVPGGAGGQHKRVFSPGRDVHYQGVFCR